MAKIAQVQVVVDRDYLLYPSAFLTMQINGTTYLYVGTENSTDAAQNGISVYTISDAGELSLMSSYIDIDNAVYKLRTVSDLESAEIDGNRYLFAAGYDDGGLSVFRVEDDGRLTWTDSIDSGDYDEYNFRKITDLAVIQMNGRTYLYALTNNLIMTMSVSGDGKLTYLRENNETEDLENSLQFYALSSGGRHYLLVFSDKGSGYRNDSPSVRNYQVEGDGYITYLNQAGSSYEKVVNNNKQNEENPNTEFFSNARAITSIEIETTTYIFLAGNKGLTAFSLGKFGPNEYDSGGYTGRNNAVVTTNNGNTIGTFDFVPDLGRTNLNDLGSVYRIIPVEINGSWYLVVSGSQASSTTTDLPSKGLTVLKFDPNADPILSKVVSIDEDSTVNLDQIKDIGYAEIGGKHFLLTGGTSDNNDKGISVFEMKNDGTLTSLHNYNFIDTTADATADYRLKATDSMAAVEVGGKQYFYAGSQSETGLSIFSLNTSTGKITHEKNYYDIAGAEKVWAMDSAVIGGTPYLFATGSLGGVGSFEIDGDGLLLEKSELLTDAGAAFKDGVNLIAVQQGTTTNLLLANKSAVDGKDRINVINVANDGGLTFLSRKTVDDYSVLEGVNGLTSVVQDGKTYVFAAGRLANGIAVFTMDYNMGELEYKTSIAEPDPSFYLNDVTDLAVAVMNGSIYLYAASPLDHAITVFKYDTGAQTLRVVKTFASRDGSISLDRVTGLFTIEVGASTYLLSAGERSDQVNIFSLIGDFIIPLDSINDNQDEDYQLIGATDVMAVSSGSKMFMYFISKLENGITIFEYDR